VSQALDRIRRIARTRKQEKFTALLHHISVELLEEAFLELKMNAAAGVDGLTWDSYEADFDRRIEDLHARVHSGAYRALPSRRVYIPKPDGRQRPLAVAALEDKIVQRATAAVLNAIYEEDFLGFSYGFRPGRGTHNALNALCVGIERKKVNWILDADIRSFFDEISQEWMIRFLEHRIGDRPPPDPEMAEGGHLGRRSGEHQGQRDRTGVGNLTAPGQRLSALCSRSLGRALATA
jgi:RNA-directed DNA polymerase